MTTTADAALTNAGAVRDVPADAVIGIADDTVQFGEAALIRLDRITDRLEDGAQARRIDLAHGQPARNIAQSQG